MGLQAIIFDLDGVLIDSEPVGLEIAQQLLADAGIPTSTEALSHLSVFPIGISILTLDQRMRKQMR